MKTTNLILSKVAIILASLGCTDDSAPPQFDPRQKFVGIFHMTKLEDGSNYLMTIGTVGDYCQNCDSMKVLNFGDRFDLVFPNWVSVPDYWFNYGIMDSLKDKNGHRWKLSYDGSPYEPYYYNAIYKTDSLKIRFKISNVSFYYEDGIPYMNEYFTHVGVRVN